jgi:hypothetical protein
MTEVRDCQATMARVPIQARGLVVISNNGRIGTGGVGGDGLIDFRLPGGCLASWNGEWGGKLSPKGWQIINDNQFTEVTGPGGITVTRQKMHPCGVWAGITGH